MCVFRPHKPTLEQASDLIINELLGSDTANQTIVLMTSVQTRATIAYHVMQSSMYFAEKEIGEFASKDEILASWDEVIDPNMSYSWELLQSWWWSP